jgi:DNA-binding transcriptional ArsR family regulator
MKGALMDAAADKETRSGGSSELDDQLIRVMGNRLRVEILTLLTERLGSPKELSAKLGVTLNTVSNHVNALSKMGLVELVSERPARGSVEHFYRSVMRPLLSDEEWERLSLDERQQFSLWIVRLVLMDIAKSMSSGKFDRRLDRYAVRVPMIVDLEGWRELNRINSRALDETLEVQAKSAERLAKSDEDGIHVSASLLCFEMPAPAPRP